MSRSVGRPGWRRVTRLVLAVPALVLAAAPGVAGQPATRRQTVATVTAEGPVFLLPDATRTPLRVLRVGTVLIVRELRDDWVQVTFNDPRLGQRTGWIQRKFVTIREVVEQAPEARPSQPRRPAPGQPRPPRPAVRRPYPEPSPGVRGVATATFDKATASQSFKAITGSDAYPSFGGGVQITNVWRSLFAEIGVERATLDGQRVFVFNNQVFSLGIPVRLTLTPVDVAGGWRFRRPGRTTPYLGAGVSILAYKETSDFAGAGDDVDERATGVVVFGGAEIRLSRWVHVRGEARFRQVRTVLGLAGVSAEFDETMLGGAGVAVKVIVGR